MIPGLFLSFNLTGVFDVLIPFLVIFIFNFKKQFYYKVLYESTRIVALICVFSIFSNYTGIFDFPANGPWSSSFGQAGFGGYRTGYSNSLFLYIPILVFWHRVKQRPLASFDFILIMLIIYAQYLSGGRAGIIASLVVLLIWLRVSLGYKMAFLAVILFASQLDVVKEQFRVQDMETTDNSLDRISSGRVVLNTYYFNKFLEAPIFGYGFGDKPEMYTKTDPHIVWLRLVIDGGIFYFLVILYLFREIYVRVKNNLHLTTEERKLFYSLFITTFIITFLEPNYIIGSVQGEIIYWIIISLLLKPKALSVDNVEFNEQYS
ncbi:O-antigen ligase family protein [Aureibaculum algae]|uniref:O-antigen ligase family protein n=1 Tax=Aureibaculum algae TaxID=2584122 RepID=A0A5B7TR85_9FLAO|nr:O-antigen ligase family protein [Aureibaculum algae]QCX38820.1 O-antigen ligase family protein [Aureibaculum algae]